MEIFDSAISNFERIPKGIDSVVQHESATKLEGQIAEKGINAWMLAMLVKEEIHHSRVDSAFCPLLTI
jgi:hypothetical protein